MPVGGEEESSALIVDHITLVHRIRGEDLGVVQRRIGRAGGERNWGFRRGLFPRGDADAGSLRQAADGDGRTAAQIEVVGAALIPLYIRAAVAVQRAVFPVVRDPRAAGNGHVGILAHIHAAAAIGAVVAGDGAAVHGEYAARHNGAVHIHAAAVVTGGIAGDGAAVHDEFAGRIIGAGHIHAAAIAVYARGRVAGDRAAVHGKCAVFDAHTAAVALGRVAGDSGIAAHGEDALAVEVIHIHTAAVAAGGRVAGDSGIAAHGKGAEAIRIHTAAVAAAAFAVISAVSGNGAVLHFECAVVHIHAAAAPAVRRVAADGAVLHGKGAFGDAHAAAAAIRRVAGDAAAVHIEFAVDLHAAAFSTLRMGDLAGCTRVAVGQGEGDAFGNRDGVKAAIRRDALAVQAQHHAILRRPCISV